MNSDFEKAYAQAAANREQDKAALAQAANDASAHRELEKELTGPIIETFSRSALAVLKREGVWCKDSWLLPNSTATFKLNKYASGLFRKHWDVGNNGFLRLTTRGVLQVPYPGITLGDTAALRELRESNHSDYGMGYRLFYNKDASELLVVGATASGPNSVLITPFLEYGARAVEALVFGWRNRQS